MQWLPRSILHQCVCCSTHGRASSQLAHWRCTQCQESALSWSAAETCKLSQEWDWHTGWRPDADHRQQAGASRATPRSRERGPPRASRGPTSLGMFGKCLGRSRSFRATPRDRYTSVTTVTAVSRVVSQKSNFQRGRPSVLCAVGLGAAPRTTFAAGPWGLPRYNTDFTLPYLL